MLVSAGLLSNINFSDTLCNYLNFKTVQTGTIDWLHIHCTSQYCTGTDIQLTLMRSREFTANANEIHDLFLMIFPHARIHWKLGPVPIVLLFSSSSLYEHKVRGLHDIHEVTCTV